MSSTVNDASLDLVCLFDLFIIAICEFYLRGIRRTFNRSSIQNISYFEQCYNVVKKFHKSELNMMIYPPLIF